MGLFNSRGAHFAVKAELKSVNLRTSTAFGQMRCNLHTFRFFIFVDVDGLYI